MHRPRIGVDLGGTKIVGSRPRRRGHILARSCARTARHDYPGTVLTITAPIAGIAAELGCL